jgi:hypothetical protein
LSLWCWLSASSSGDLANWIESVCGLADVIGNCVVGRGGKLGSKLFWRFCSTLDPRLFGPRCCSGRSSEPPNCSRDKNGRSFDSPSGPASDNGARQERNATEARGRLSQGLARAGALALALAGAIATWACDALRANRTGVRRSKGRRYLLGGRTQCLGKPFHLRVSPRLLRELLSVWRRSITARRGQAGPKGAPKASGEGRRQRSIHSKEST